VSSRSHTSASEELTFTHSYFIIQKVGIEEQILPELEEIGSIEEEKASGNDYTRTL